MLVAPRKAVEEPATTVTDDATQSTGRPYTAMTVGVPKESFPGEQRVCMMPETCEKLVKAGFTVIVEKDAGALSDADDEAYTSVGCEIGDPWSTDVLCKIRPPTEEERTKLADGQVLFSNIYPRQDEEIVEALREKGVTAFGLDCVPRTISRAQAFDTLSSMANISGYKAVVEASNAFPRFMVRRCKLDPNLKATSFKF